MLQDVLLALQDWLLALAGTPWVYVVLFAFVMIDGFFPPVPSESAVIALATLSVAGGSSQLVYIALAAAFGAFAGDQIAYTIGSRVDVRRLRLFRSGRGKATLDWAEHALMHRGSSFILAARYIPVGRVAVNLTAGTLGYPRRRFVGLTGLAAVTWSAYSVGIGVGAGAWLEDHPIVAVVAGVAFGTVVGLVIDWALRRWTGFDATPVTMNPAHVRPEQAEATVPADPAQPPAPAVLPATAAGPIGTAGSAGPIDSVGAADGPRR